MKEIARQLRDYLSQTDKRVLVPVTFIVAILVYLNYSLHIDQYISSTGQFYQRLGLRFLLNLFAFAVPYLLYWLAGEIKTYDWKFFLLVILAALVFSVKMSVEVTAIPVNGYYWQQILYWPVILVMVTGMLSVISRLLKTKTIFTGLPVSRSSLQPYFLLLLMMVPLVLFAASTDQFREVYPKFLDVQGEESGLPRWLSFLIFEISYGSDFITIEFFFRGFLVLGFLKWAGRDVILPMASFYCVIHFGKPPLECISSFFGGIILGVIVHYSRSVIGGLIAHLGIAWLMEAAGYLSHILKK